MSKDFSARDQLRRAAILVSNNIAEGFEYYNNRLFVRFLMDAKGSAVEIRSLHYVLKEAGIIDESVFKPLWEQAIKLSKNIEGFREYLRTSDRTNPKPSNLQSFNLMLIYKSPHSQPHKPQSSNLLIFQSSI